MTRVVNQKEMGKRIKILRLQHNVYQTILAKEMGVSQTHMSNIESGRAGLTIDNLVKLSEIFSCTLDEIVFGEAPNENIVEQESSKGDDYNLEDCTIGEFLRALKVFKVMK